MEPTTLARLIKETDVALSERGFSLWIPSRWVVPGEDRLSYTTIICLVECCREHHWKKDILPHTQKTTLDSICRKISADFLSPVDVRIRAQVDYFVTRVGTTSYDLAFEIRNCGMDTASARVHIRSVFFDPETRDSLMPPVEVQKQLELLLDERRA